MAAAGDIVVSGPPPDADGLGGRHRAAARPGRHSRTVCPPDDCGRVHRPATPSSSSRSEAGAIRTLSIRERALASRPLSVTVVAKHGIDVGQSDTKVAAVLGPQRGLPLIEANGRAAVLFVRKTDKGEEASSRSAGGAIAAAEMREDVMAKPKRLPPSSPIPALVARRRHRRQDHRRLQLRRRRRPEHAAGVAVRRSVAGQAT